MSRNKQIDGLRAIAMLVIVIYHYTCKYCGVFHPEIPYFGFMGKASISVFGVSLFALIFGYFFSGNKRRGGQSFIRNKVLRIWPIYFISITLVFLLTRFIEFGDRSVGLQDYLLNIPFINGFISIPFVDGAHWYITMWLGCVIVLAFIHNRYDKDKKWWYLAWLLLFIMLSYFKSETGSIRGTVGEILYKLIGGNAMYFPVIMIGVAVNLIQEKESRLIGVIISAISLWQIVVHAHVTGIICFLCALVLFCLALRNKLHFLEWKPLQIGGNISFSVYIIHQNLGYIIMNGLCSWNNAYSPWISIAALALMLPAGYLINKYIEKPLNKLMVR